MLIKFSFKIFLFRIILGLLNLGQLLSFLSSILGLLRYEKVFESLGSKF